MLRLKSGMKKTQAPQDGPDGRKKPGLGKLEQKEEVLVSYILAQAPAVGMIQSADLFCLAYT